MHTVLRSRSTPLGPAVRRSCAVDLQPTAAEAAAVLGSIARASVGRSAPIVRRVGKAASGSRGAADDRRHGRKKAAAAAGWKGGTERRRVRGAGRGGGGQLAVCSVVGVPSVARSFGRSRTAAGVCQRAGAGGAGLTVGRIVGRTGGSRMLPAATAAAAAAAASQCPALTLCWSLTTPAGASHAVAQLRFVCGRTSRWSSRCVEFSSAHCSSRDRELLPLATPPSIITCE